MTTPKVLLKRSSVVGKVPTSGDLDYGELAINFADGKIYYKNSSNQIVAFIDSARTQALIDAVNQTAENQLDSAEVIALIDSAYVQARQSYDALTLGGDSGDYYRNYNNLFNKPLILDIVDVQNIIDARVNQTFVDNLNIDADTLDGLNSTQFLRSDSDTRLTASLTIDSNLTVGGDATFNSNVTLSGNLYGPAVMYIDPEAHDSDTGKVVIRGDLQVDGTQTIVNSTTVSINDKNIILADSAVDSAEADGAGITVNGANATITYNAAEDEWQFNKKIQSPNLEVTNVIDATTVNTTNITSTNITTTNITGNYTNFDSDFDSALGTKTTTNLIEGDNLYYTTTRADSDFDNRLTTKTTTDLTEGDNLYYTTARADSDARSALSARKISGFGDLTYDSAAGKFSYTGISTQEVRDQFAAQGDLSYDSSTGVFSIDVEAVYTKTNFDSDLGDASTDDLPEGDNLYYTTVRHDSDFDVRFATKTTDDLTEGSTNLYYTTARQDSDTKVLVDSDYVKQRVKTDQDLLSTSDVTFNTVTADDFIGDLSGAVTFIASADVDMSKGQVVYVTGVQGNTSTIDLARANDSSTMPAMGFVSADVSASNDVEVVTFGNLQHLDVADFGETGITFGPNDIVYVSASEAGHVTNVKPSGESNLIQNIGRIQRHIPTTNMAIKVGGAGRTNATPNLDNNQFFLGNDSNYAVSTDFATAIADVVDSAYVQARVDSSFIAQIADLSFLDSADALQLIDSAHVQLKAKGLDYNVLSNKPALIDSALVTQLIDSNYIRVTIDSAHIENVINNSTTVFENNVDSSYVQLKAKGLDYDVLSNKPALIDSTLVSQLIDSAYIRLNTDSAFIENIINNSTTVFENNVDSAYVQLHAKGLDYNVLSNKPNILDSSDIVSIIVSETLDSDLIINLVDSAYIQLRDRFQDSAGVKAVIDSAYVRARVKTDQNLRTIDSVSFAGITVSANSITWGESDATMTYLPDSDMIEFNKPVKGEQVQFTGATIQSDSGTFNGLYVYDNRRGQKDWVARFSRRQNEYSSPAVVLISTDAEQRSDLALEIRGNANSNLLGPEFDDEFHDDSNTTFAVYGSGHTLIGYSNLPGGVGALYPYSMLAGDNNIRLQVKHGISVDSNIVFHAGNYTSYIDSAYIEARRPAETIFSVGGDGSNYLFSGDGFPSTANDPTLYLTRGKTYKFTNIPGSHPFEIRLSNGGSAYSDGVTNNGGSGTVEFTIPMNAPTSLVYQCTVHSGMVGDIVINAAAGLDSAQIINLIDSAYVQLRDSSSGGGGGGGGVDSATTIALIDSAYVKARVDHNANEVLIFGDDQQVAGTLAQSNTSVVSFFNSIYPDGQFIASYNYASGGLPIGQWLYGYYWVNSAHGYFQVVSKTDLGNGTYRYYCENSAGNPAPNWAGGWTNYVVIASIVGATEKALRISHQTNGDYIFFDGRRNFYFSQNDSDQRNFKIELTGTSALEMVGGKHIHYGNSYDSDGDFPNASVFKGMVAHAKNNDALYYANDSGLWTTIAGTGAQAFQDSAVVLGLIDSDYILNKKFVPGDAERRWNITTSAPTGAQEVSTGDFWLDRNDLDLYRLTADNNWTTTLPAGTFTAEPGLTSYEWTANGVGGSAASFNIGPTHIPPGPNGSFDITFLMGTSPYNSGGRWTFTNPAALSYFNIGNAASGHIYSIGYTDGSYMVSNTGINGSKTATPSSYTWYDANNVSLGKTISNASGTIDIRHPNGVLASYFILGRNNYGTRGYSVYMFFAGGNTWQRVGEIYDSGDIKNLIDSAYISGLGITGTDSATVQGLIDASLDSAALPFSQTFLHYTSDSGQKVYSGFDDDSQTLSYTAGALAIYLNGILLIDSVDYTATDGSTVTLTDSASLGDILTVQKFSGNSQTAATQAIIDSNFLNVGSDLIPSLDSTYDLGSPTKKWKDLYLSGNSIYLGGHQIRTDGNNIRFIDSNGNTVGLQANNLLDSADVISIIGSETLDSALIVNLVDSAYIQLRDRFQDSAGINAVVDSAYVRQRVTRSDLDMLGNKVLFANVYDSTGSFPSASTYHGMFAHAHNTGAGYFAHAGAWTRLANHSDLNSYSDSDVLVLVDSAYVQARQTTGGGGTVDSADIIAIVDSAYVQARQSAGGGGTVDSADIIAIVDSAYVQARQTSGGGGGGLDSALVSQLIDSDYIGTKVDFTRGEFVNEKSQYTATAAQTVFSHSSIDPTHLDVYLNGVLQVVNDDYTATSSAVTFASGVDSGYSVTVVEKRGRVLTQRGLVESKYYFTTPTPITSITGADDNGITLDYSVGNLDVYLNGILLKDSDDYSTNAGTTVTLVSATDSNDLVTLINRKGVVVTPNVKNYEFTATAGQTTFSGSDVNSNTLSYVPGALQVHLNGILLRNADFTAVSGSSVILADSASLNDELVVSAFSNPGQNMELYKFTADSGQTIFNGNDLTGASLAYQPGNIQVFMNGLLLNDSDDYTASNGMSVVLTSGADLSDEIKIASFVSNTDVIRTNAWTAPTGTPVTAAAGDKLFIDTSSAKTITLPSSASMGDEIRIIDVTGNASTNNITVSRNGHNIQGAASDLTINVDRAGIGLVYYNSAQGWVLIEN